MSPLIWAILLLLFGIVCLLIEMFIPSGGVLTILAAAAILGSIFVAYAFEGLATGTIFFAAVTIALPLLASYLVRLWPQTSIGRRILNIEANQSPQTQSENFNALVGRQGRAKSKMLPSGAIVIDGRTYDAVTLGMAVEQHALIEVCEVRGNKIVVRPVEARGQVGDGNVTQDGPLVDPFDETQSL